MRTVRASLYPVIRSLSSVYDMFRETFDPAYEGSPYEAVQKESTRSRQSNQVISLSRSFIMKKSLG